MAYYGRRRRKRKRRTRWEVGRIPVHNILQPSKMFWKGKVVYPRVSFTNTTPDNQGMFALINISNLAVPNLKIPGTTPPEILPNPPITGYPAFSHYTNMTGFRNACIYYNRFIVHACKINVQIYNNTNDRYFRVITTPMHGYLFWARDDDPEDQPNTTTTYSIYVGADSQFGSLDMARPMEYMAELPNSISKTIGPTVGSGNRTNIKRMIMNKDVIGRDLWNEDPSIYSTDIQRNPTTPYDPTEITVDPGTQPVQIRRDQGEGQPPISFQYDTTLLNKTQVYLYVGAEALNGVSPVDLHNMTMSVTAKFYIEFYQRVDQYLV